MGPGDAWRGAARPWGLAVALVVMLSALGGASGCGADSGDDECARVTGDCPNEPSLAETCRQQDTVCPATARALFLCAAAHQVCDGRGRLDLAASKALCEDERIRDQECRAGGIDAAVDARGDGGGDAGDAGDATLDGGGDAAKDAGKDALTDVKPG